ncbi:MAG: hypothetical protein IKP62_06785 [Salinivirgaceae bacterium]|nr:hypothetical protein [Salinivirgaceae bacterium]
MNGLTSIDSSYIITSALAAAFVVAALVLMFVVLYYRWRLIDSHSTLARFIRENVLLRNELEEMCKTEGKQFKDKT